MRDTLITATCYEHIMFDKRGLWDVGLGWLSLVTTAAKCPTGSQQSGHQKNQSASVLVCKKSPLSLTHSHKATLFGGSPGKWTRNHTPSLHSVHKPRRLLRIRHQAWKIFHLRLRQMETRTIAPFWLDFETSEKKEKKNVTLIATRTRQGANCAPKEDVFFLSDNT